MLRVNRGADDEWVRVAGVLPLGDVVVVRLEPCDAPPVPLPWRPPIKGERGA